jgi:hypothetical protein
MRLPKIILQPIVALLLCAVAMEAQERPRLELARGAETGLPGMQFSSAPKSKSVLVAILGSIVLPGLGEYYAGSFETSGKYALTAEGVIWVSYSAFRLHGGWVRDDARAFAAERAGASLAGKDARFEVDMGNFLNVQEYNLAKLRNRETDLLYTDPSYQWSWGSDADRARFKDERIRSDRIFEASKFVIAAAVVNRIVSAFSAGRAAAASNRAARASFSVNMDYVPEVGLPRSEGAILRLGMTF